MLFSFIRYTQPSWQFNLTPGTNGMFASCYITEQKCPKEYIDERYQTKTAQIADAGYHLWNQGVLLESTREEVDQLHQSKDITLVDEYIFIRKYWGKFWATFAFILRIFTFKNPFIEIKAYHATRKIKRINVYESALEYRDFETFESPLIASKPLVAVIIPTLNRYNYLKDVLHDLEKQSYRNFEVIVVDQSDDFQNDFYEAFNLQLKIIHQKEKLLWTARNNAVKATDAEYLLFFDDDSSVEPSWIEGHLKCLDFFNAHISAGVSLAVTGQKISPNYNFFRWADQFDSGNAMIKRTVMKQIGMFDEQFNGQRMGDGEFGFRAYVNGLRSISNPKAFRIHFKVSTGGLREMGSWDGFRPKKWFAPKPIPSVIYLYRKYLPASLYKNAILLGIMLSNVSYKNKRSSKMLFLSVLLTIVKSPLLLIQYNQSNKIAQRMLCNNYKPELLK
ncbi:MAG TPA: glycosyltransferase family A protein [Chitinophagaceae bacterium]|nr:glycosyltransferase family A protein [Chitinophagaceae bacterium]